LHDTLSESLQKLQNDKRRFFRLTTFLLVFSVIVSLWVFWVLRRPGITLVGAHTMARPVMDSSDGWWTQKDDMNTLINLTAAGRLKLADLIDETHSPEETTEVFTRLAFDKTFPLVQFDWRKL
jgi:hypothetical protein